MRGRLWPVALGLLLACGQPPSPDPGPVSPSPISVSASPHLTRPRAPRQLSPSEQAWEFAESAKQRLGYIANSPEGNGYQALLAIKARPKGLLELAGLARERGHGAVSALLDGPHGQPGTPFHDDYVQVLRAATYRHLAAPVTVPKTGPIAIPEAERFVTICSALRLLPALEMRNSDREEQLANFRVYLGMARAICRDAATIEHYQQGLALEETALTHLAQAVKSGRLTTTELRQVISGQQQLLGSAQELQPILDSEYLLAVRRLEAKKLDDDSRKATLDALSARFLAARPLFADPELRPRGDGEKWPAPVGQLAEEWAKQEDFLPVLVRSRRVATQRSAVELLAGLEAYRKDKGRYPDTLQAVVPAYLSRMPEDWITAGGQFAYRKTEKGFTLESVSPGLPGLPASRRLAW